MSFTVIFDPKHLCVLKDELGDTEECDTSGIFVVKPEDSSNLSGVIEGCKVHLPKAGSKPELFILEQKQYGKPNIKVDDKGEEIWKDHKYSDGRTVYYPETKADGTPHPDAGKPVQIPIFEKKPVESVIQADEDELKAYLLELTGKL